MKNYNLPNKHQDGVVLIVSLMVLVLVTILAISVVNRSTLLQRMAGNIQGLNSAFQATENGVVYFLDEYKNNGGNHNINQKGSFLDGSEYEVKSGELIDCGGSVNGNSINAANDSLFFNTTCFEIRSEGVFGVSSTEHRVGYATRTSND